jgi:putative peptidoglycan lipid II flippase
MTIYVWGILAGSAVGLLASTLGRLYASTYYALHDTRTPLRFALIRVVLTIVLGYVCAIPLPRILGVDQRWGVAGLTASAGLAGWVEFMLLRSTLNSRIGQTGVPLPYMFRLWSSELAAASAAWVVKLAVIGRHPLVVALFSLGMYGIAYFAVAASLGIPQAVRLVAKAGWDRSTRA